MTFHNRCNRPNTRKSVWSSIWNKSVFKEKIEMKVGIILCKCFHIQTPSRCWFSLSFPHELLMSLINESCTAFSPPAFWSAFLLRLSAIIARGGGAIVLFLRWLSLYISILCARTKINTYWRHKNVNLSECHCNFTTQLTKFFNKSRNKLCKHVI